MLRDSPGAALQYGITEGFLPLREWLAARLRAQGIPATAESVMVVSGSQQGIDLVARVLLNPGDTVLVENPSYVAALQAFAAYEAKVVALPGDDDGLRTELLEEAVRAHRPALIYLVPEFQNPRGTTLARDRRRELVAVAARHGDPGARGRSLRRAAVPRDARPRPSPRSPTVSPSTSARSPRRSRPGCASAGSTDRRP